jgi:transposase
MMEYFSGLDVSLRSCALCIVDGKGTVLFERKVPCEVSDIAECLVEFPHPIERVGFEAGTMSQHIFFGVTAEGFDDVCMKLMTIPPLAHACMCCRQWALGQLPR